MALLGNKENKKVKHGKNNNVYNTETMLPISEIRGNTILLKDDGLRAIVKVTWLNIDLKNYDEQLQTIEQYKRFLNGLDFPLQILIRNNYLELSDYISYMRDNVNVVANDTLKKQGEGYISFLSDINSQQGLIYVKEFYVIIPYYPLEQDKQNVRKSRWRKFADALSGKETPEKIVERYRSYQRNGKFLDTRISVVIEGLRGVGIYAERLGLGDIISLMFKEYNPDSHKDQATIV